MGCGWPPAGWTIDPGFLWCFFYFHRRKEQLVPRKLRNQPESTKVPRPPSWAPVMKCAATKPVRFMNAKKALYDHPLPRKEELVMSSAVNPSCAPNFANSKNPQQGTAMAFRRKSVKATIQFCTPQKRWNPRMKPWNLTQTSLWSASMTRSLTCAAWRIVWQPQTAAQCRSWAHSTVTVTYRDAKRAGGHPLAWPQRALPSQVFRTHPLEYCSSIAVGLRSWRRRVSPMLWTFLKLDEPREVLEMNRMPAMAGFWVAW